AQYQCRTKVETDYNIKIVETANKAYSVGGGPGFLAINKSVNAGDCDYDLALIAGYDVSVLAYNGFLYDMNSIPGIDLSKSWWGQRANESLSVRGVMFFTTGDITVSDNDAAFCMMFNKKLLHNYGLEDPYQLVYDNKWTIENFGKLCKTVTEDLDQDGVMNENDRYGLLVWDDSIVGMVNAVGERCCTISEDGEIELTFYSERTLAALEQYTNIAYDRQYALTFQRYVSSGIPLWKNDQGLFLTGLLGNVPRYRDMESDFGVLPYPKLDEAQDSYHHTVAPYNSQFICVPLVQNDVERTGTLTEALAYYGQKIVKPAYYDVTLKGQSSRDEESEGMVDIILDTMTFDIGYYYQIGPYNKQLILALRAYDNNFASMYDTYKNSAQAQLKVINQYYSDAVDEWIEK
ncbi:MAG: extracellular solute-binding protein, partial [Clostridia bacterium]|nr:extracellular solute-binding protein [Clostridia bacterium]